MHAHARRQSLKCIRGLRCAAILFALLLSACHQVQFQSAPGDSLVSCDPAWVGDWRLLALEPDSASDNEDAFVRVEEECAGYTLVTTSRDEHGAEEVEVEDLTANASIAFARSSSGSWLVWKDRDEAPQAPAERPSGYTLYSYTLTDQQIDLQPIYVRKAAHLIIDGVVPGWIEKQDRRVDGGPGNGRFFVYVFGSSTDIAQLLDTQDLQAPTSHRLVALGEDDRERLDMLLVQATAQAP